MVKEIILTKGKVALVDDEDYERVSEFKWCVLETQSNLKYGYRFSRDYEENARKGVLMHRWILIDVPSDMVVDHINGNGLDNRKENLRICTRSQNNTNKRKKGTTSKYKGVYWDKNRKKFRSHIIVDGKSIFLGRYLTELEAALAYDEASKKYHGEFANNNGLIPD